jgi:hypothetical protein
MVWPLAAEMAAVGHWKKRITRNSEGSTMTSNLVSVLKKLGLA